MLYERRGVSLLEILLGVAIFAILIALTGISFISFQRTQQLESESQALISILRLARGRSITAEGGKPWGVHFEMDPTNQYTIFRDDGGGFSGATKKTVYNTGNLISIDSFSIAGGGADVIFQKLAGSTTYYGTGGTTNIAVILKDSRGSANNVIITSAGKIDVE